MGLDWVVLSRTEGEHEINPTEVIGAVRATRHDPAVIDALRGIWESQGSDDSFDAFLDAVTTKEPPPIVIPFGPDARTAMPAVRAEVQYYGYRGKALEPELNRISAAAENEGEDLGWMWGRLSSRSEIESRISELERILAGHRTQNEVVCSVADEFFSAWQTVDEDQLREFEARFSSDTELGDHVFEVFSYLGAIAWLQFWSDKGFVIAADF